MFRALSEEAWFLMGKRNNFAVTIRHNSLFPRNFKISRKHNVDFRVFVAFCFLDQFSKCALANGLTMKSHSSIERVRNEL